jgi:hypothetical protein
MLIGILVGAAFYFVPFGFPFFFFFFFIFFIARFLFAPWWWFSRGYRRRYHHPYWPGQSGPDPIDGDYVSQRPATGEGKRFTVN